MNNRLIVALLFAVIALAGCGSHSADTIVIGGKKFSEQSILGEMYAALIEKKHSSQSRTAVLAGRHSGGASGDPEGRRRYLPRVYRDGLRGHSQAALSQGPAPGL